MKEDIEELKRLLNKSVENISFKGELIKPKNEEVLKAESDVKHWKSEKPNVKITKGFKVVNKLIDTLIKTTEYNGMIISGEGGIGKTFIVINHAKKNLLVDEWEYSNGYTTPLAIYEFLFRNRNKKLLILDDVEGLFDNHISLSILKGCLWETDNQRIVQYSSNSGRIKDLPKQFILKANIIILTNRIPRYDKPSTKALISRTLHYEMVFSFKQKLSLCKSFLHNRKDLNPLQKSKVELLLDTYINVSTKDFNFRTLKKAIAFVKTDIGYSDKLFSETINNDDKVTAYLKAVAKGSCVDEQIELFRKYTDMSRRTFFVIKSRVQECSKIEV